MGTASGSVRTSTRSAARSYTISVAVVPSNINHTIAVACSRTTIARDAVVISPIDCGAASVGGVEGMLGGAALGEGFTEVSVDGVIDELLIDELVVAEVSAAAPVEAEPAHQSLLARAFGEAFR